MPTPPTMDPKSVKKKPADKKGSTEKPNSPKSTNGKHATKDSSSPEVKKPKSSEASPSTPADKTSPTVAKKTSLNKVAPREIVHPKAELRLCTCEQSLTPAQAKKLLGWTEESENVKFPGSDYLLKDTRGKKIRCLNNVTNRPIYASTIESLCQEILRGNYIMNFEPAIIGKTGLILNGQHNLIALVFAGQIWEDKGGQYSDVWKKEPTIEKLVCLGCDEGDRTVNTMDTCKPRTLADVIYRSDHFRKAKPKDRRQLARIMDHAVRMLWYRTGAGANAFSRYRTHAESLDFIRRHPRILECVRHIYEEDGTKGQVTKYLSPGYASALLYLQGSSTTDRDGENKDGYIFKQPFATEKMLEWKMWEKAQEFWVNLASGHKDYQAIRGAISGLVNEGGAPIAARMAILVKAWNALVEHKAIKPTDLALEWSTPDDDSVPQLTETPTVGGIDLGKPG